MEQFILQALQEHWIVATCVGALVAGENGILIAFLFVQSQPAFSGGVILAAYGATLAADLSWYWVGRYGIRRFQSKKKMREVQKIEPAWEHFFDRHILLSLLCIKFLVGLRVILTLYLAKKIPLKRYLIWDSLGIWLFLGVLWGVARLVHQGTEGALETYQVIIRVLVALGALALLSRLVGYFLQRRLHSMAISSGSSSQLMRKK